jgi:hypothetical protein
MGLLSRGVGRWRAESVDDGGDQGDAGRLGASDTPIIDVVLGKHRATHCPAIGIPRDHGASSCIGLGLQSSKALFFPVFVDEEVRI